jgi:ketosteroid isomerase-like protein
MFHQIIRNKVVEGFKAISRADFDVVFNQFAPDIHFSFAGQHAIGGEFHQSETVKAWFARVHRLFPDLRIEPKRILVSGMIWNVTAVTNFTIDATLPDGTPYHNDGFQILNIRLGKVVKDYLIEDTMLLCHALQKLQALGIEEASAAPLQDGVQG